MRRRRAETTRVLSIRTCEHDTQSRHSLTLRPTDSTLLCLVLSSSGPAVPFSRDAPIAGTMNGFSEQGLDEDAFGASKGGIASFDAFRKCFLWMRALEDVFRISRGAMREHAQGSV